MKIIALVAIAFTAMVVSAFADGLPALNFRFGG
jgi:hypothetical protein